LRNCLRKNMLWTQEEILITPHYPENINQLPALIMPTWLTTDNWQGLVSWLALLCKVSWFCMDFFVQGAYLPGDFNLRKTQVLISWGKSSNDWMKTIFLPHRYAKIYQEEIWRNVFEVGIFPFGLPILFFLYKLVAVFTCHSGKGQKALWVFWSCCPELGRKNWRRCKIFWEIYRAKSQVTLIPLTRRTTSAGEEKGSQRESLGRQCSGSSRQNSLLLHLSHGLGVIFILLTWLDYATSTYEAHAWVYKWGLFHRGLTRGWKSALNRRGTNPTCWGHPLNEKWQRRGPAGHLHSISSDFSSAQMWSRIQGFCHRSPMTLLPSSFSHCNRLYPQIIPSSLMSSLVSYLGTVWEKSLTHPGRSRLTRYGEWRMDQPFKAKPGKHKNILIGNGCLRVSKQEVHRQTSRCG
jgi:hypothetical protein